jgi:protein-L-isoaspartate O-methyltransferase
MSKTRWQKHLRKGKIVIVAEGDRTSSEASNVVDIAQRLRQITKGIVMDIGCGGGFTTERVLQEIQTSVCSMSVDIDLGCVKFTGKRAELLGMSDRNIEICADARHQSLTIMCIARTLKRFRNFKSFSRLDFD